MKKQLGAILRLGFSRFIKFAAFAAAFFSAPYLLDAQIPPDRFVRINGGTFMMGSPAGEPGRMGNEMQREVTLSPFYMMKFHVTQAEYEEIMGTNPSHFRGANLPVERVSWFDAIAFSNRLSELKGLTPVYTINGQNVTKDRNANGFRLPTEAEWEFAARAGTTTPFWTGDNITTAQANFDGTRPFNNNPSGVFRQRTMPVGSFPPNAFGLYDMHGNVGDWCWDWNVEYARGPQVDPLGAATGFHRVFRGGSWNHPASFLRSARRGGNIPSFRGAYIGIRLVRNADPNPWF